MTAEETTKPEPLDKVQDNATPEDFIMKNKVYELIRYGNPILDNFPRYERYGLAQEIRQTQINIMHHVITLENKHYKKTTLGELDTELDWLRQLLRLAQDRELHANKKPCISLHQYEVWSRKVNEIGRMIGGYFQSLNPQSNKNKK